jgi:hypothetical protein
MSLGYTKEITMLPLEYTSPELSGGPASRSSLALANHSTRTSNAGTLSQSSPGSQTVDRTTTDTLPHASQVQGN